MQPQHNPKGTNSPSSSVGLCDCPSTSRCSIHLVGILPLPQGCTTSRGGLDLSRLEQAVAVSGCPGMQAWIHVTAGSEPCILLPIRPRECPSCPLPTSEHWMQPQQVDVPLYTSLACLEDANMLYSDHPGPVQWNLPWCNGIQSLDCALSLSGATNFLDAFAAID